MKIVTEKETPTTEPMPQAVNQRAKVNRCR